MRAEPKHFFVPPYVGPRGWLGVRLDQGIAWKQVGELVRAAYENTAPSRLRGSIGKTPVVPAPKRRMPLTIEGELVAKSTGTVSPFGLGDRVFHQKFGNGTSHISTVTS